ncbi:MAG: glycosyltransferase [Bacilli bacterium]
MKNKILYFGNFDCINGYAAINRVIGNACIFDKLGYEINIYCHNLTNGMFSSPFLKNKNIHLIDKPFSGYSNYFRYAFYEKQINDNPSTKVVVMYNMPVIPFQKITKLCKRKNICVISDVTEWYDTKNLNPILKPIKFFDTSIRMNTMNYKADGLIVISEYLKIFYLKNYKKPLIKIPPIMDFSLFDKTIYNKDKGEKIVFGYIGSNRSGKDEILDCLQLIANNPHKYEFMYIGSVNDKIKKRFSRFSNINFIGKIGHRELARYYEKIDYNIIVRKKSRANNAGFPTKFAESICYNTPVICNDFSDIGYILKNYNCGILIDLKKLILVFNESSNFGKNYEFDEVKNLFLANHYKIEMSLFLKSVIREQN